MDKEIERRRSWLWKKKNGFGDTPGGTSPTPVKLFDEQEVARILEDQVRSQQERMECTLREVDAKYSEREKATLREVDARYSEREKATLREVDAKYSEREKAMKENLDSVNKKLAAALAEITVKDNLVKQHIRVSEEAVIGWERAETEVTAFKQQRDAAVQQKLATEDRVEHLDGALKEVMKQLRCCREEQQERIHEMMVSKTQEYDHLRSEMDSKLAEANHFLTLTRGELMECRAENLAISNALQERSRTLAEVNDAKTRAETNMNVLQVHLEGVEKENGSLKYDIRLVTKGLEARMSELDHARKAADVTSKQLAEAQKKVTKLDEECNRLRTLVRKKTTSNAVVARLKQDMDPLGRGESGTGGSPRRRSSTGRAPGSTEHTSPQEEENLQSYLVANASAEKIRNLQQETRSLKETLAKRNDELQNARIMCAKTASRLSSVEEEVEALRSASKDRNLQTRDSSLNFELMDDFEEMERLALSQSHFVSTSSDQALTEKNNRNLLEAANQKCEELSAKLAASSEELKLLHQKNTANEQLILDLQNRALQESSPSSEELTEALQKLAQITKACAPREAQQALMESASVADVVRFSSELVTTLEHFLELHHTRLEEVRKERDRSDRERLATFIELESARGKILELEEEMGKLRDGEMRRIEDEVVELRRRKKELESNLSEMDQHLVEANERVESLRVRLSESEALVSELQTQLQAVENTQKEEENMIEQELMELSESPHHRRLEASMRAADAEMHHLQDKVAALEVELQGERQRHQEVVSKLEDLQQQIHRGVGRLGNHSPRHANDKDAHLLFLENDATKTARKEKEIAAAALAECQRTILALGKQLKLLTQQQSAQPAATELLTHVGSESPPSPNSIEKMTHTMESLRSQADRHQSPVLSRGTGTSLTWAPKSPHRPALPGLYYRQNNKQNHGTSTDHGPLLLSLESSEPDDCETPASSPARSSNNILRRSVRTIRGSPGSPMKAAQAPKSSNGVVDQECPSASTTYQRFYSRSQSETSMSSDNSNPGPVYLI